MGYTTEFSGYIDIVPPLSNEERDYINKFSATRRMKCKQGPYYVDRGGFAGQGNHNDKDIINYNSPPDGQPGLWCQWVVSEDGSYIEWDGCENFYSPLEWMEYLIEHFLKDGSIVMSLSREERKKLNIPDFVGHICNGVIKAQGEDMDDRWKLVVTDNKVEVIDLE